MSDGLTTAGYAVGNVLSSVAIVLVNKKVFAGGFHFPLTLSFFHFCFTVVFYAFLRGIGLFELPNPDLPTGEKFKIGLMGFASIALMNVSLSLNSVGFYQITKLTIVPVTLAINYAFYAVSTSSKIKLALAILLAGVGVATVSDVSLRPLGFFCGLAAVVSTAFFQIWQGSKQKDYGVSGTQLQNAIALSQCVQSAVISFLMESSCEASGAGAGCDSAVAYVRTAMAHPFGGKAHTMKLALVTCFLALSVNWCSFGLIGRTSAITFQVVGHAKTCLILLGGFLFFSTGGSSDQFFYNMLGVSIAMVGVVLYGHLKHAASQNSPDCLDSYCPSVVSYSVVKPADDDES